MTQDTTRRLAAVWFADIVGYIALASESEDDALTMLNVFHRQALHPARQMSRPITALQATITLQPNPGHQVHSENPQNVSKGNSPAFSLRLPDRSRMLTTV